MIKVFKNPYRIKQIVEESFDKSFYTITIILEMF